MAQQITPPVPPAPQDPAPQEESTPKEDSTTKSGKFIKFVGTRKVAPTHKAGSHYLITQTQLVEAGVPRDKTFVQKKDAPPVTEIMFSPENEHKVPVESFYPEALNRLLQEPDLVIEDTSEKK